MISISLCMIVKDEECFLGNCLSSVKEVIDEFIIVDTGSTDRTKEIIKEYTDSEYSFTWINDFAAARNYAFSLATKDYILWLDADDILKPEDLTLLKQLKETLADDIDVVSMIYDITFNEKGECTLSIPRDKLIRNHRGFFWHYFVHEELVVWGKSLASAIHITHTSDHGHYSRYLKNYEQRIADGYELLPHERYFYGGELFMAKDYEKCIDVLEEFMKHPSNNTFEQTRALEFLEYCYQFTNQPQRAISTILAAFVHVTPTANHCFTLGNLLAGKKEYEKAIFWYTAATVSNASETTKELLLSCYLQLCVCHYSLGHTSTAIYYNDLVLKAEPENKAALFNQEFFSS